LREGQAQTAHHHQHVVVRPSRNIAIPTRWCHLDLYWACCRAESSPRSRSCKAIFWLLATW